MSKPEALCPHRTGRAHQPCVRCRSTLGQRRPDLMAAYRSARKDADEVAEGDTWNGGSDGV